MTFHVAMLVTDVLIVGSSLSSMMTTLNLKHRNPDLDVTVLGPLPTEEKRPMVGESLVEPGILFFREVGLGPHLDEMQVLKNGLTFYHKFDLWMDVATRMFSRRRDMRLKLLAMNGNKKLLREIPRLLGETIRPMVLRLLPKLRPAVFAALRPPLEEQYARWTGPDRDVPEPDVPYVGGLAR